MLIAVVGATTAGKQLSSGGTTPRTSPARFAPARWYLPEVPAG